MVFNAFKKFDKKLENSIEDLVYGKEDIFIRNARRLKFEERYGTKFADSGVMLWVPGWVAYKNIKLSLKNKEYTTKQKIASIGIDIGLGLIFEITKFGAIYGGIKLVAYTTNLLE